MNIDIDTISETLGVETDIESLELEYLAPITSSESIDKNITNDYLEARKFALRAVIRGEQLLDVLAKLLLNSNEASDFDVYPKFVKGIAESSKSLISLSEQMEEHYKKSSGFNTTDPDDAKSTIISPTDLNK